MLHDIQKGETWINKRLKVMAKMLSGVLLATNVGVINVYAKESGNSPKKSLDEVAMETQCLWNKIL